MFVRALWVFVFIAALLPIFAPTIITHLVMPRLDRRDGFTLELHRLDYTGLDAAVSLGDVTSPWLETGSVHADYTAASLAKGEVNRLTITGARLYLCNTGEGWRLRGTDDAAAVRRSRAEIRLPRLLISEVAVPAARIELQDSAGVNTIVCDLTGHDVELGKQTAARIDLRAESDGIVLRSDLVFRMCDHEISLVAVPPNPPKSPLLTGRIPGLPGQISVPDWRIRVASDRTNGKLACSARVTTELGPADGGTNGCQAGFLTRLDLGGNRKCLTGDLHTESAGLRLRRYECGPMRLDLPVMWPLPEGGLHGNFHLDSVASGKLRGGPLSLNLTGNLHGLSITGYCAVGSQTAAIASVSGTVTHHEGKRAGRLSLSLPLGNTVAPLDLRQILPNAPPANVRGTVSACFTSSNSTLEVAGDLPHLEFEHPALTIEGLKTRCLLNAHALPASLPAQLLTIERAALGSLSMQSLELLYRVELDKSFTIRGAHAQWCGGKVDLQGVTLRPGGESLDLLVHVDRILVGDLFRQLGLPTTSGDSTVSGRIPVNRHRGQLRFTDGFLSTRPGRTGVISFGDTDAIAAALAAGAGRDARLALVSAALKEFAYEWITLTLNSKGDELAMQMSLFGKPAKRIPFKLENRTGVYVVTSRKEEWSSPKMQVDLNFNIPLDDILNVTTHTTKLLRGNLQRKGDT